MGFLMPLLPSQTFLTMTNNHFTGESQLFFANKDDMDFKPLGIVEDSTSWECEDVEPTILDEDGDKMVASPNYSFDLAEINKDKLEEFLNGVESNPKQVYHRTTIQEKKYVLRPNNLKYPNKKRKKRILKKWEKRFGFTGGRTIVIPKAKLHTEQVLKDGIWQTIVTIVPIEEPPIINL